MSCDNCQACFKAVPPEAIEVADFEADGVAMKRIAIHGKGILLPQHSHAYDHMTLVAAGEVIVSDGEDTITRHAPEVIRIRAGVEHSFVTLSDETVLCCIHNVARSGRIVLRSVPGVPDRMQPKGIPALRSD